MAASPCLLPQVTVNQFEKSMTPERRAKFWEYAKTLGANVGVDHATVIEKMSQKFNIPQRLMAQALDGPKTIRRASDDVRFKQKMSQRFLAENARYLEKLDETGSQTGLRMLGGGLYKGILAGHGPVISAIHPLDMLMTNPVLFAQQYFRGWQAITNAGRDRIMTDMKDPLLHPDYKTALDAGLPVGDDVVEGFQGTGWASRAMDASLKPLRLAYWENYWYKAPKEERTPELARSIASGSAHATGAMIQGEPIEVKTRGIRKYLLAPQYTPSKIAKTIIDPLETAATYERMITRSRAADFMTTAAKDIPGIGRVARALQSVRPATFDERYIANIRTQRAARFLGATMGALALNDAILKATGSQQSVNFMHPSRSDFLAFKGFGHTWRMRGSLEIIALMAKIAALNSGRPQFGAQSPEEAFAKYSEYKLAPGIGLGKELLMGKDVFGRPSAWSGDPGSRVFPQKNWIEEIGERFPIFVGHGLSAFHEALRDQGVDTRQSRNVINAIGNNPHATMHAIQEGLLSSGLEFFGVNVQPDRYVGRPGGLQEIYKKQ